MSRGGECLSCGASCFNGDPEGHCSQCGQRKRHRTKLTSKHQHGLIPGSKSCPLKTHKPSTWSYESYRLPALHLNLDDCVGSGSSKHPGNQNSRSNEVKRIKAQTAHAGSRKTLPILNCSLRRIRSFDLLPSGQSIPAASQDTRHVPEEDSSYPSLGYSEAHSSIISDDSVGVIWGPVLSDAVDEVEARKIILTAEIDSDERCMCVLAQRLQIEDATRSKLVISQSMNQVRYKYNELDKKVRINKEKLTNVEQRLSVLQAKRLDDVTPKPPENDLSVGYNVSKNLGEGKGEGVLDRKRTRRRKRRAVKPPITETTCVLDGDGYRDQAATRIQKRFRALRARRLFGEMVRRVYQRVCDPDSKRYFYYNSQTSQSQWEAPPVVAKVGPMSSQLSPGHRQGSPSAPSLNEAASRIQALYRRRAARAALRELLTHVYEKVYDADSNTFYYYCSRTKTSSWEKPRLLRDEDIQPRVFEPLAIRDSSEVAAAKKIQMLFRNRATRLFVRDLAKGNIERYLDADSQSWYYYNSRTQQTFWEQPRHASLAAAIPKR